MEETFVKELVKKKYPFPIATTMQRCKRKRSV